MVIINNVNAILFLINVHNCRKVIQLLYYAHIVQKQDMYNINNRFHKIKTIQYY